MFAIQAQQDNNWVSEIWQSDWDGGNDTDHQRKKLLRIACVYSFEGGAYQQPLYLCVLQARPAKDLSRLYHEGKGRRIVDLKGNQLLPTISPNRNKIAFICDAAGRTDLFIQSINADKGEMGKPVQLFSYPRSTQASPTFSPDGSKSLLSRIKMALRASTSSRHRCKKQRADATLITKKIQKAHAHRGLLMELN